MARDPIEIIVSAYWLSLISGVVLPMAVAFVTNRFASGTVKTLTLILFSVLTGTLAEIVQNDGRFELWSTIGSIILAFGTAVISHFGILKPTNITGSGGVIQMKIPGGVGQTIDQVNYPRAA